MIAKLKSNRVRRTYRGGGRIDAFVGNARNSEIAPYRLGDALAADVTEDFRPEDWLASTTTAFNGSVEIEGEGLGYLDDGRLVKDTVGTLPILVKLLDSDERLVIQAHPTVPFAKARMNSPVGKTECWYFLPGTAEDASVYLGFKPGITRERWEQAVRAAIGQGGDALTTGNALFSPTMLAARPRAAGDELLSLMHRVPVKAGDFVFVDGGVPHAIGGGCFMIELQEPSDLMVVAERFTPSGREIPSAKIHGGLGYDGMFDVYEYDGVTFEELCRKYVRRGVEIPNHCGQGVLALPNEKIGSLRQILGSELTDKFEMWELRNNALLGDLSGAGCVVVVTDGEGLLNGVAVRKGDRLVASGEVELALAGEATAVVSFKRLKQ